MLTNENKADLMLHTDEIGARLEYLNVLMRDVIEGFMMPLVYGEHTPATLAKIEAEPTLTKCEMVSRFLGEIEEHHKALIPIVFTPDPIPDHSTMTDDERVKEITCDILKAVEQIAKRPDWLEAMKSLNMMAWAFAWNRVAKMEIDMGDRPITTKT